MVSVLLPRSVQEVVDTMASKNPELVAATTNTLLRSNTGAAITAANKLAAAEIISNQRAARAAVNKSM